MALPDDQIDPINSWRERMFRLRLIGSYSNGIGYGNISARNNSNSFVISGSGTGGLPTLGSEHYTLVHDYDLKNNSLCCSGPIMASSESLSHAVIYDCSPETNAVIHIHNKFLWNAHLHKLPSTDIDVAYGTPDMADEIIRLFRETDVSNIKKIIMGGHQEGIIVFGNSPDEAGRLILEMLGQSGEL
jgi:ribulose-5-phosphate 4-epimerase/fuculose-1-phosphate aldolase